MCGNAVQVNKAAGIFAVVYHRQGTDIGNIYIYTYTTIRYTSFFLFNVLIYTFITNTVIPLQVS